ncbi:BLOC-3 complex member HPS4 [Rhinophrynus dorsalis]
MASSVCVNHKPASWLNYFFLYDGSKVKGEGDPTIVGINYFYPPQTIFDQQELLCGQIAGVVRCMTEIANSPPNLIRLKKQKFAILVQGDYLWALGCSPDVSDVSCKQLLEDLIGLFRFYNGPLAHAYKVQSLSDLKAEWNLYVEYIQNNTNDLHRIFNSLGHLDKTKVDPLLLLKAALILQTCQRFPHIRAGCILYKNRIVSTQLPPSLTSKILVQRAGLAENLPSVNKTSLALPQDVYIIPVFILENEAIALRQYPAQWMTRIPTSRERPLSMSSSYLDEGQVNQTQVSDDVTLVREREDLEYSQPINLDVSSEQNVAHVVIEDTEVPEIMHFKPTASTPMQISSPLKGLYNTEMTDNREQVPLPQKVYIGENTENVLLTTSEQEEETLETKCKLEITVRSSSSGSFASCNSIANIEKNKHDESDGSIKDILGTFNKFVSVSQQNSANIINEEQAEGGYSHLKTAENNSDQVDTVKGDTNINTNDKRISEEASLSTENTYFTMSPNISDRTLSLDSTPSSSSNKLVQMILYIHNIKGLVLSLMAECCFIQDKEAIQDVYDSTLASLNGLEVHLKETLPTDKNNTTKSTYSFTHYDSIQNILTANLPSVSSTYDHHFLRAANLIHSDFSQHKSLQEIIVRNASYALYGCQSTVHETYFQHLAPPIRNSGVPDPQDSAFVLPSKAKQKLLKHGLNLL